jgi:predicted transcriptional regulator
VTRCASFGNRTLLVSIRPAFAAAAYAGLKRFEYRRVQMNARRGDRILVYESRPISKITGEFRVGSVIVAPVRILRHLEPDPGLRHLVSAYLRGATVGTALEICAPNRWSEPSHPHAFFGREMRPPVSYQFVSDN